MSAESLPTTFQDQPDGVTVALSGDLRGLHQHPNAAGQHWMTGYLRMGRREVPFEVWERPYAVAAPDLVEGAAVTLTGRVDRSAPPPRLIVTAVAR